MSKLDTIVKQLKKAGFTAHRTTSEINCKVSDRSVYITAAANGETVRLSLMGKGQYRLTMPIVNATGEAPHCTTYMNSWTIKASALVSTLKAVGKAVSTATLGGSSMNYPVTTAIEFLRDNTALNTDEAVGYEDPNISGTILVEHLFRNGEEVQALVYLDAEGRHDFEVAD